MKTRLVITVMSAVFLLLTVGITNTQAQQVLLPGALIPKFVDPLPVAGDISVVSATTPSTSAYTIHMREFQAQILPSTGVPLAVPAIPPNTPSWVWGYLTDADVAAGGVRKSYLGPVVVAQPVGIDDPGQVGILGSELLHGSVEVTCRGRQRNQSQQGGPEHPCFDCRQAHRILSVEQARRRAVLRLSADVRNNAVDPGGVSMIPDYCMKIDEKLLRTGRRLLQKSGDNVLNTIEICSIKANL